MSTEPAAPTASPTGVRRTRSTPKGKVTVRYHSRLHHIGIGRDPKNRPIKLLIRTETSTIDQQTGELPQQLTLTLAQDHQPIKNTSTVYDVPTHHENGRGGIRTPVRGLTPETVFETAAFNHSATLP
jgi:hypothetical protein